MGITSARSRLSSGGWALYAALACACVFAVWVPIGFSAAFPVKLLDGWGVLSGYLGLAWVTPAGLIGLAASRFCRERGAPHPNAIGAVLGIAALLALVVALAAWMTTLEGRWEERDSAAQELKSVVDDPVDRVRRAADQPLVDVVCRAISDGSFFCAATYEGPACQLWSVTADATSALPPFVEGAIAIRTDRGVRCTT